MYRKYKGILFLLCLLLIQAPSFGQSFPLKGTVIDEQGQPVAGVSILNRKTHKAVTSNDKGEFKLEIQEGEGIFVLKSGYRPFYLNTKGFTPSETDSAYTTTVTIRNKNILPVKEWEKVYQERPVMYFDRALMGEDPGVFYAGNGMTGISGLLMLRGLSTVNLDASPYIMIDGLPVRHTRKSSPFASGQILSNVGFVHPLDIAGIKVVNNGFEASEYGGKSGNGILSLAIDEGQLGSATIEAAFRIGFSQADYGMDLMNSAEYRPYLYAMMLDRGINESDLQNNILFDASHAKYNHQTDWMNIVKRNGMFKDFQLKMKGGDGDTRYLFSIGYTGEDETIDPVNDQRFNMRFNLNYKITPKIRISNLFSYNYGFSRFFGEGSEWLQNPIYQAATKAPFMSPNEYTDEGILLKRLAETDAIGRSNPAVFKDNLENKGRSNRVDAIIKAQWDFLPRTTLNADIIVSYSSQIEKLHQKAYGIAADRYIKRQNSKRTYSEYLMKGNLWIGRNGHIGNNILFDSKLGMNIETYQEKMIYGRKVNAATDEIVSVENGTLADSIANTRYEHHQMNFYLSGKFNCWNFLDINANLNLERSSNFGPEGSWNLYAGVGLEALIWHNRHHSLSGYAQWGRSGNNDVRGAYYARLYKPSNYIYFGGVYLGNIENKELKPEITDNYDFGIQTRLFDRLLSVRAGYYFRKTHGLITQRALPIEMGLDPQFGNNGEVLNQGLEASAHIDIFRDRKLKWSIFANIATLKNEIKELKNGDIVRTMDKFTGVAREGEAIGSFFGYKVKGIYQNSEDVNLLRKDRTPFVAGDYKFEDINDDGIIDANDRQVIGSPLPDFFGGFGTNLSYKNLSFSALFTFSYGNDVYNLFDQKLNSMSDYSNQSVRVSDRWLSPENPGKGFLPRAAYNDPSDNFATSDRWVEDGSYLKLKSISLSYDVPLKNRSGFIKGINVSANCNNLFTVCGYNGFDPEVFSSVDPLLRGVDTGSSPNPRSYIIGLKISL